MNLYGNTCPMCCGDLDFDWPGAAVCPSCGCRTEASVSTPRQPDAQASGVSAIMRVPATQASSGWTSPLQDIQMQRSAGAALTELTTG
jgi:uncharacterized Zn finger protein (UPF0148 family)